MPPLHNAESGESDTGRPGSTRRRPAVPPLNRVNLLDDDPFRFLKDTARP